MVGDDHQIAHLEVRVHTARCVRYKQRLDAQGLHHADGEGNLLHRVALIVVETALHGHDILIAQGAENQAALVALNGRYGEVGHFAIRDFDLDIDVIHNGAQAGTQNDGGLGQLVVHAFPDEVAGLLNLVQPVDLLCHNNNPFFNCWLLTFVFCQLDFYELVPCSSIRLTSSSMKLAPSISRNPTFMGM